jgi:hypothetical protein
MNTEYQTILGNTPSKSNSYKIIVMDRKEKERIIDDINSHYKEFETQMNALESKEFVWAYIELLKLIIDGEEE